MSSSLYFRFSAMNAGKSTAIIQIAYNYEERDQRVLVIKPAVDTKSEFISSRIGAKRKVDIHATEDMDLRTELDTILLTQPVHCIIVDEAQFLMPAQVDQLFYIAVMKDIPVIAYGLRTDFQTHFFPGSARLMELAHSIEELKTICRCGKKAIMNGRKVDGIYVKSGSQVAIDGDVEYESLCGKCYIAKVGFPPEQ